MSARLHETSHFFLTNMTTLTALHSSILLLQESIKILTKKLDAFQHVPTAASILLFTQSSKGTGRDKNDSSNKQREKILETLLSTETAKLIEDPTYGSQWRTLLSAWKGALEQLAVKKGYTHYTDIKVESKGGRGYNYDYLVNYVGAGEAKVEFKFGGTSVSTLPEYFNPDANKPFHPVKYADFFYDNYLDSVLSVYDIPNTDKPSKEVYLKHVHSNSSSLPFFNTLYDKEKSDGTEKYKAKAAISHASIQAYLHLYGASTDLALLTSEFQRSQSDKTFLLYQDGVFHIDQIRDEELIAKSVIGVQGDSLLIQSAAPGTVHKMLLRWKNHHCVLLPAWQISMIRKSAAPTLTRSC